MELPFEKRNQNILIKKESDSNNKYGKSPETRTVDELLKSSIINLNKPAGPSSHQVADYVKKILNVSKAGHSGTLDPNVTGVLAVAIGDGTRIVQALLSAGKEYVCLTHLHKKVSEKEIKETAKKFVGEIEQLPPIKSAVKRQKRIRNVYYLEILEIKEKDVLFKIGCEAGTYIRKIAHDWGEMLKVGAHMGELVRTKAGPFTDDEMVTLHDLKDTYENYKDGKNNDLKKILLPIEKAVDHLKKVWILDTTVDTICHGALLSVPGIAKLDSDINVKDLIAILTLKGELVALGTARMNSQNILIQEKGIVAGNLKVFMKRGTYPKFVKK